MGMGAGILGRVWRSAYSVQAYREMAAESVGRIFGYLALLIAFATVIITISTHLTASRALEAMRPWIKTHVPEMRISHGTLSSPVPQPYLWEQEGFGFVLDATGATVALDPKHNQGVLLTSSELIFRRSPSETRRYAFAELPDLVVDGPRLDRWIDAIRAWLWLVVAIVTLAWLWTAKLLQVLFWSLIGLAVAALSKRRLRFSVLVNIGIYALTVSFVFDLVVGLLGWGGPALGLVSLALYGYYFGWGIFAQPVASDASPPAGAA